VVRFEPTLVTMCKTITNSNSVSLVGISQKTQKIFILKVMPHHNEVKKVDKNMPRFNIISYRRLTIDFNELYLKQRVITIATQIK